MDLLKDTALDTELEAAFHFLGRVQSKLENAHISDWRAKHLNDAIDAFTQEMWHGLHGHSQLENTA